MRRLFGMLTAALLGYCWVPHATANADTVKMLTGSGLVCDTKEQAERFILLMGDNVESTLRAVNREAGDAHACVVATFGFVPGAKVADIEKDGRVVFVLEVKVMAVATVVGLQLVEPKTYYTVIASKQLSV